MKQLVPSCLATALLALLPVAAFAHAHLESAQPVNGSVVAASPPQVVLVFSEPVALLSVSLEKAGARPRKLGPLPPDAAHELRVALPKLAEGAYTLRYRAVSDDTHEAKGVLRFTVGAKRD